MIGVLPLAKLLAAFVLGHHHQYGVAALPATILGPPAHEGFGGAVVTESLECSEIGRDLLARGVSLPPPPLGCRRRETRRKKEI